MTAGGQDSRTERFFVGDGIVIGTALKIVGWHVSSMYRRALLAEYYHYCCDFTRKRAAATAVAECRKHSKNLAKEKTFCASLKLLPPSKLVPSCLVFFELRMAFRRASCASTTRG